MYPEGQNHLQFKITDHTYVYLQNGIILQIQPCLYFFYKLLCHELVSCQLLKTYCIICNVCRIVHQLDSWEVIYVISPPLLDLLCKTEIIWHTLHDKLLFKFKMSWTSIHIIAVGCWPNYPTSLNSTCSSVEWGCPGRMTYQNGCLCPAQRVLSREDQSFHSSPCYDYHVLGF